MSYSFGTTLEGGFEEIVARVREALQAQGFGVLTEADISAAMKGKLGIEFPPYLILGACNPPLAHQALQAEPAIGVLLPCNVVVREDSPGSVEVLAMDPAAVLALVDDPQIGAVTDEVRGRLERMMAAL